MASPILAELWLICGGGTAANWWSDDNGGGGKTQNDDERRWHSSDMRRPRRLPHTYAGWKRKNMCAVLVTSCELPSEPERSFRTLYASKCSPEFHRYINENINENIIKMKAQVYNLNISDMRKVSKNKKNKILINKLETRHRCDAFEHPFPQRRQSHRCKRRQLHVVARNLLFRVSTFHVNNLLANLATLHLFLSHTMDAEQDSNSTGAKSSTLTTQEDRKMPPYGTVTAESSSLTEEEPTEKFRNSTSEIIDERPPVTAEDAYDSPQRPSSVNSNERHDNLLQKK